MYVLELKTALVAVRLHATLILAPAPALLPNASHKAGGAGLEAAVVLVLSVTSQTVTHAFHALAKAAPAWAPIHSAAMV